MKKLIVFAVLLGGLLLLGYSYSRERERLVATDAGLAELIEKENRSLPKDMGDGATLQKLETRPGRKVVSKVTLSSDASEVKIDPRSDPAEFACKDREGRWLLDHGVVWVSVILDRNGAEIFRRAVQLSDCKDRKC